jgi:hypothetical protein
MDKNTVCSQYQCLSCPLSIMVTGKDCEKLTDFEVEQIMTIIRDLERLKSEIDISNLFALIE